MTKPEPKMPRGRQIRMVGVAFAFEILQTIGGLLVVFAPLLVCYFAQYWVEDWSGSQAAGEFACWAAGSGLAASYIIGVGAGIAMLGWLIGAGVSALSIVIFIIWFWYIGVSFLDKMGPRIFIMAGNSILEFLPFVNVLPWSTASIWLITETVRKDDKEALAKYEAWEKAEQARKVAEAQLRSIANDNRHQEERRAA